MRSIILLAVHILVVLAKMLRPGGIKAIIAENLLLKQQLIVLGRSRRKAPNLRSSDRFILGGLSLFISARRRLSAAVIMKPSTLLKFHRALVKRKYRRLFGNKGHRRPGPQCTRTDNALEGSTVPGNEPYKLTATLEAYHDEKHL
jgi:putative transposase